MGVMGDCSKIWEENTILWELVGLKVYVIKKRFMYREPKNKVENLECRNVLMPEVGYILQSSPLPQCFGYPILIPEKYVWDQQLPLTFHFLKLMEVKM